MSKYQVKKYYEWGSLKLEPLQYLIVEPAENSDSYIVIQENTKKQILVTTKAFHNFEQLGYFIKK